MRHYHVGEVIVVDKLDGKNIPVSVLTDWDLVIEIIALDVDVDQISVGYIMSAVLITIGEDYSPSDTLNVVQQHGVRRQPEVDSNGVLPVLIDMEIILKILCQDLDKMLALINTERNIQKCLRS